MKQIYSFVLAAAVIVFAALVFCCQTVAQAADVGAQVAAATGAIDQNTANAISTSSKAIGSAVEEITPEQEYYIGRAVGANILASYKVWDGKPALAAYANQICNAIVINSPRPDIFNGYHVMLLDSDEINAFATSGGHIFITRGLINAAKTEDALAGVIAHEVAHIQLQHSIKSIRNSRATQALMITGASAAGAVTGYNVTELTTIFNESVNEIVVTLVNSGYSQQQEFEADNTALGLLASAGYKPSGLTDMLGELAKIPASRSSGFGKTHPSADSRLVNANKSIGKYRVADTSSYRRTRFSTALR